MATITVTTDGLAETIREFQALPAQIKRARRRAMGKVTRAARTETRRTLARVLGAKAKEIGARVANRVQADGSGLVWIGALPVAASRRIFGTRLRSRKGAGVQAGTSLLQATAAISTPFIATMPSGHEAGFSRTGQFAVASQGRYAGQRREKIAERRIDVSDLVNRQADGLRARLPGRLATVLRQELVYETTVRGR